MEERIQSFKGSKKGKRDFFLKMRGSQYRIELPGNI